MFSEQELRELESAYDKEHKETEQSYQAFFQSLVPFPIYTDCVFYKDRYIVVVHVASDIHNDWYSINVRYVEDWSHKFNFKVESSSSYADTEDIKDGDLTAKTHELFPIFWNNRDKIIEFFLSTKFDAKDAYNAAVRANERERREAEQAKELALTNKVTSELAVGYEVKFAHSTLKVEKITPKRIYASTVVTEKQTAWKHREAPEPAWAFIEYPITKRHTGYMEISQFIDLAVTSIKFPGRDINFLGKFCGTNTEVVSVGSSKVLETRED